MEDTLGPYASQDATINTVPVEMQIAKSLDFIHKHGQRLEEMEEAVRLEFGSIPWETNSNVAHLQLEPLERADLCLERCECRGQLRRRALGSRGADARDQRQQTLADAGDLLGREEWWVFE